MTTTTMRVLEVVLGFILVSYVIYYYSSYYQCPYCVAAATTVSDNTSNNPKKVGFYHLGALNSWREVMREQIETISVSGLLNATDKFKVVIMEDDDVSSNETLVAEVMKILNEYNNDTRKMELLELKNIGDLFEINTLVGLYYHCLENPDDFVYYLHSKGTSTNDSTMKYKLAKPWRQVMQHFLFTRWREVYKTMKRGIDLVGVNYFCNPYHHFSGNFWWASCRYLNNHTSPGLPTAHWTQALRYYDEAWILDLKKGETVKFAEAFHDTSPRYSFAPSHVNLETMPNLPWEPKFFMLSSEEESRPCPTEYIIDFTHTNYDIVYGRV